VADDASKQDPVWDFRGGGLPVAAAVLCYEGQNGIKIPALSALFVTILIEGVVVSVIDHSPGFHA
jgi:hypothetical protein